MPPSGACACATGASAPGGCCPADNTPPHVRVMGWSLAFLWRRFDVAVARRPGSPSASPRLPSAPGLQGSYLASCFRSMYAGCEFHCCSLCSAADRAQAWLNASQRGARRQGPTSALRSARSPVNLTSSPIHYANRLIGSPITPQSTGPDPEPVPSGGACEDARSPGDY